ncbi:MAG: sodium/solute symporter [Verrucomicrobiota bacterium]|nr:sodium/solute symporter [Verrucomicrobiota bacterium]
MRPTYDLCLLVCALIKNPMFGLSGLDLAIVGGYFLIVMIIGMRFGKKGGTTHEFIVGGRSIPTWAVICSIIATEISAVTFLAVPGASFAGNLNYLQFGVGSIVARFVIAALFIGLYYKFNCLSIYEFLAHRFGSSTHYTASGFFIVTRVLASGVRLLVAANGLAVFFNIPVEATVIVFTITTAAYTFSGGIKAVVATDVVQAGVFVGSVIAVLIFFQFSIGWETIWPMAQKAGHLELFHWAPKDPHVLMSWLGDPNLFFLAFVNGLVMTTAALGVDQDLAQRMLTCTTANNSKRSVIISGLVGVPIAGLFLLAGVGLFAFFQLYPDPAMPAKADDVFPYFIATYLPSGMRGLLLAGILAAAMSSLSSTMGSLSSSAVMDFYKPLFGKNKTDAQLVLLSRILIAVFGLVLAVVAIAFKDVQGFLWWSFKVGGITYGSMLGVFLLGVLTKNRGHDGWNIFSMLISAAVCTLLLILLELGKITLAWSWLIIIGTTITFVLSALGQTSKGKTDSMADSMKTP